MDQFIFPPSGRPTWAEVDLGALVENYQTLRSLLGTGSGLPNLAPRLIPVIKADAYGHGAVRVARALSDAGAACFAVALVEEAVALREAGIFDDILVLNGAWPGQEEEIVRHDLLPAVYSPEALRRLASAALKNATTVRLHINIDSGMGQLGAPWNDLGWLVAGLRETRHLQVAGTYSHLASAEEDDPAFTEEQIGRFQHALQSLREAGVDPGEVHFANSAGLLYFPSLRTLGARPGIALYGYPPAPARCSLQFKRVLTLKTRIGRIYEIPTGESVGYNRRFVARRPTRAATLPVGYADGYRRGLTGLSKVIIRNRWAEVLGTISMDMLVADVTEFGEIREGDEVILLGSSQDCCRDATAWAGQLGTIPYEILCGIGSRVPRVYTGARSPGK